MTFHDLSPPQDNPIASRGMAGRATRVVRWCRGIGPIACAGAAVVFALLAASGVASGGDDAERRPRATTRRRSRSSSAGTTSPQGRRARRAARRARPPPEGDPLPHRALRPRRRASATPEWNAKPPTAYNAAKTRFMGLEVSVNRRISRRSPAPSTRSTRPAAAATGPSRSPASAATTPSTTARSRTTCYGIAIDIDPEKNVCCGCVGPWPRSPRLSAHVDDSKSAWRCPPAGSKRFERFGFYWLGRDELEDTMHFEFLGDPSKIKKGSGLTM